MTECPSCFEPDQALSNVLRGKTWKRDSFFTVVGNKAVLHIKLRPREGTSHHLHQTS